KGKVVLVGTLSKENPNDFASTPFSRNSFSNPKLVIHANILDSIINDESIIPVPKWVDFAVSFVTIAIVLWVVLNFTPLYGVFATLGLAALVLGTSALLFRGFNYHHGIWMRSGQPLIGLFIGYYLAVPYRLIREYKK